MSHLFSFIFFFTYLFIIYNRFFFAIQSVCSFLSFSLKYSSVCLLISLLIYLHTYLFIHLSTHLFRYFLAYIFIPLFCFRSRREAVLKDTNILSIRHAMTYRFFISVIMSSCILLFCCVGEERDE